MSHWITIVERMRSDAYDEFADSYEAENASSLLDAHYERPAMLDLAGDVSGRRILDAGCGSGPLLAELRQRGATVTGIDGSAKMIELARPLLPVRRSGVLRAPAQP